jgi:ribosomal protein S6--L-glutamate ligase
MPTSDPNGPIVSYHPGLAAEENLLLVSQRPLDERDREAVARAAAVLLPQVCRPDLYALVAETGKPHFPRPAVQLSLDGKVGKHLLFTRLNLPCPRTLVFSDLEAAARSWRAGELARVGLAPPLVAKGAGDGEGRNVFLVRDPNELLSLADELETACTFGPPGLVLQELVDSGGRDLRVVLVGDHQQAYWRVGQTGDFRNNLSQGGRVEREAWPDDMAAGLDLARRLQAAAGLDLAGVDVLVPTCGGPLLLEINFYFGRQALGGLDSLRRLWLTAVRRWLVGLGIDPGRARETEQAKERGKGWGVARWGLGGHRWVETCPKGSDTA